MAPFAIARKPAERQVFMTFRRPSVVRVNRWESFFPVGRLGWSSPIARDWG
jgi:hypothetical protein